MTTIRAARPDEAGAIQSLVRAAYAVYVERIGRKPAPMLADYPARIADGSVFVLSGEGGPQGIVVMLPDEDGMFVENLAVSPAYQGRGLGRQLLAFVEESARRRGLASVHLYTNEAMTENLSFYARLGFEEVGRHVEDGYRRVFFRKRLN